MLDLEARIRDWKWSLVLVFGGHHEIVEELESHLREEIDRLIQAGQTPTVALATAQAKLGRPVELAAEYSRAVAPAGWWLWGLLALFGLVLAVFLNAIFRATSMRGDLLLTVHVTSLTIGYLVAFQAAFLSLIYVLRWVRSPVTLGERRLLGRVLFLADAGVTFLLLAGLLLGMVWARAQWERFWDNDPREIATLLAVLWFGAITGLWLRLPQKQHLWMLCSLLGGSVGVWAWFGPHLLPLGLRGYGFSTWLPSALAVCTAVPLALTFLGMLPAGRLRRRSA